MKQAWTIKQTHTHTWSIQIPIVDNGIYNLLINGHKINLKIGLSDKNWGLT